MKKQCPDDEMLADYTEDRLSDKDRHELEAHLAMCEICFENLWVAKSVEQHFESPALMTVPAQVTQNAAALVTGLNTSPWDSIREKTRQTIHTIGQTIGARISDYIPEFWGNEPLLAIRSTGKAVSDDCVRIKKNFKYTEADTEIEFETEIEIDQPETASHNANIRIRLIRHSKLSTQNSALTSIRITLKKDSREISSSLMNEDFMVFEEIPPGNYNLVFGRQGKDIGTCSFEIKETCHGK